MPSLAARASLLGIAACLAVAATAAAQPAFTDFRLTDVNGDRGIHDQALVYNPRTSEYLHVYTARDSAFTTTPEVYAQRLSGAGDVLDRPVRITSLGTEGDPGTIDAAVDPSRVATWSCSARSPRT